MTPERPRPARQSGPHHVQAEVNYLQHADGSWSLVGRDGWPVDMDDYRAQLTELESDMESLAPLGVTVIDVEPVSARELPDRE
ncbi:hypothetical protein ACWDUL_23195 [Nocardia niigatensis]